MKKRISIVLLLMLCLFLGACANQTDDNVPVRTENPAETLHRARRLFG